MKVLLVTSEITFVPRNYNELILEMAAHPAVAGLLVIQNKKPKLLLQGLLLLLSGLAPRLGFNLVKNYLANDKKLRKAHYENQNKIFLESDDINSVATLGLINEHQIDLIVNARTRSIFKKQILSAPRLGCLNIHHGILPNQRGLMCDLWALANDSESGFSIHQMTPKLDDGEILVAVVNPDAGPNYLENLRTGTQLEALMLTKILGEISLANEVKGYANSRENSKYFKNPGLLDLLKIRLKGFKL